MKIETEFYGMVPKDFVGNLRFRSKILSRCGEDPGFAEQVYDMCRKDILFYVNVFGWTFDPRQKVRKLPFITYSEFQDPTILDLCKSVVDGYDVAIPKSRCMGASWIGLTVFEWFWHFYSDMSFLLISRNESYVDETGNGKSLFWKIDFLHNNQPRWLLPTGRWLGGKDPNRRLLHLGNADNGSVIDGESTTGDAGRGDRRTAMYLDEFAAVELRDGYKVLNATRDTTNCRIFNSTPKGNTNAFYDVVHETSAKILRLHWTSHPVYNKGLYRNREVLDGFTGVVKVMRKGWECSKELMFPDDYPFIEDGKTRSIWYDNECARCVSAMEVAQELDIDFLGSNYQFFDAAHIHELVKLWGREPFLRGNLMFDKETLVPRKFVVGGGDLELWMNLKDDKVDRNRTFVYAADISAGTGASNSVGVIADIESGEKVGRYCSNAIRPTEFADLSIAIARFFNNATLIFDASGPTGQVFSNRLLERRYNKIYYRPTVTHRAKRNISDKPGYFLNPDAKSTLMGEYREALSERRFINHSEHGLKECLQFVVQPGERVEHSRALNNQDPSGSREAHGDEVIADALACYLIANRNSGKQEEMIEVPYGSLAWRMAEAKKKREKERQVKTKAEMW